MELILNKDIRKLKVYVGMCVHREMKVSVYKLFKELEKCPDVEITTHILEGDALISRSRSRMATEFLKSDAEILFFLDDDILYNVNDLRKLCLAMKEHNLDIAGGAYMLKREIRPNFAIGFDGPGAIDFGTNGGLLQIRFLSNGFMAIRRKVFEKMIKEEVVHLCKDSGTEFYPFFKDMEKNIDGTWMFLSEDWAFCERARELGFKIWLDTTIRLGHMGNKVYTWDEIFKGQISPVKSFRFEIEAITVPKDEAVKS